MQDRHYEEVFALSAARRGRFVMVSTYLIAAFAICITITLHVSGMTEPRRLGGNALLLLGMLTANLLCRNGRLIAGAHVLVWTAFAAVSVVCYASGGFRSPASNVYLTIVAFAGWLLGMRYMIAATGLSMLALLGLFMLGGAGLLPVPAPTRPLVQFATTWMAMALGGMLFYFVVREMHRNWLQEMALRQDLRRANDELEAKVAERTQELSRAKDAAEQASRAKGAFLANMSHEIRTPMHAILGLTEVLLHETTDPRSRDRLTLVAQASDHLLALINNVLDISKIESGKFELAAVEMRVGDVFSRVLAMLHEESQRKGVTLAGELDVDASQAVLGDPMRLVQVLLNFAGNALKFTDAGTVTLRCRVVVGGPAGRLFRFEVQDTGIGVSSADRARIFESFEQGDGAVTRAHSGSGLGLAINRHLVRAMGGEIGLESRPGQGSLFWFSARLPPVTAAGAASPAGDADPAGIEHVLRHAHAGARVLVVDDNEVNRIVARAQLNAVGIEPDDAADGEQAVEMARRLAYDLILMDIHMPTLDGVEAARRIRRIERYRDTPIIALTADAFSADRQRFLDAGMSAHLAKPLQARQLYAALVHWLAATMPRPSSAGD